MQRDSSARVTVFASAPVAHLWAPRVLGACGELLEQEVEEMTSQFLYLLDIY